MIPIEEAIKRPKEGMDEAWSGGGGSCGGEEEEEEEKGGEVVPET